MNNKKLLQIKEFIDKESEASKIYIGCDSKTYRRDNEWFAQFYLVVVIHKNGCNGCKIFGEIVAERDFNYNRKKPRYRLMQEVYKCAELYLQLSEIIPDRSFEVHLDISPNKKNLSSTVVQEAIGYIRGTCAIDPKLKPNGWAASYCADRVGRNSQLCKVI